MSTLDLNGNNITLPDGTIFTTPYLGGSNNVTNNGFANATLTEGGGPSGTIYSGVISDGAHGATTAITQTGGNVTFHRHQHLYRRHESGGRRTCRWQCAGTRHRARHNNQRSDTESRNPIRYRQRHRSGWPGNVRFEWLPRFISRWRLVRHRSTHDHR
jgi:hypothetical protein